MVDDKGGPGMPAGEIVAGNALAHGLTVPNDQYAWSIIEGGKTILEFRPNGEVVHRGRLLGTDEEIYKAIKEWSIECKLMSDARSINTLHHQYRHLVEKLRETGCFLREMVAGQRPDGFENSEVRKLAESIEDLVAWADEARRT